MRHLDSQLWNTVNALRRALPVEHMRNTLALGLFHQYAEVSPQVEVPEEARIETVISHSFYPNAWRAALQAIISHNENIEGLEEIVYSLYAEDMDSRILTRVLVELSRTSPSLEEIGFAFSELNLQIEKNLGRAASIWSTPASINELGVKLLDPAHDSTFYDGSAGMSYTLLAAKNYTDERARSLHLYGEEKHKVSWALGRLHLILHGAWDTQFARTDTLLQPAFLGKQSFDYIMMEPPYSMKLDEEHYEALIRDPYGRSNFGLPPRSSADMAFILHALASLNESGKAVIVLPNGALFRSGAEAAIRKALLQADVVEAIIALPQQLHHSTGIPINLLVLNRNKRHQRKGKVLFIHAQDQFTQADRRTRQMESQQIDRIVQTFHTGKEMDQFSQWVNVIDIHDGNLLASKYLQSSRQHIEGVGMVEVNQEALEASTNNRPLQTLANLYRGINALPKELQPEEGGYGIIRMSNVQDGELQLLGMEMYRITNNAKVDSYLVQEGDVIISSRGANVKIAVIPSHEGKLLLSQNFIGIRPTQYLNSFFLKAYLESPVGQFLLASMQVGTTITTISPKSLGKLPVPVLDMDTQLQIGSSVQEALEQYQQALQEAELKKNEALQLVYHKMGIDNIYTIVR